MFKILYGNPTFSSNFFSFNITEKTKINLILFREPQLQLDFENQFLKNTFKKTFRQKKNKFIELIEPEIREATSE